LKNLFMMIEIEMKALLSLYYYFIIFKFPIYWNI
jgi:hypothetical protein